ncbi:MAG TPA: hypothetical protein VI383_05360 [Gemmatimonadales bacterium]|nr:hypothetical protein [Gemmatimonadales bacterium]
MLTAVRRKLAMAVRVRDFCRIHLADDPTYRSALDELEERLARADVLATQQRNGSQDQKAATERRRDLRRLIQTQLLPQLARVDERVARKRPDLASGFRLPRSNAPLKTFQIAAKAMLAKTLEARDLFVSQGMPAAMLDALTRGVAEFDEVTAQAHGAKARQVGATADLLAVTDQISKLVRILGGFNEFRFDEDRELKAAWLSASDTVGPFRGGVAPPDSGLAPAA